MNGRTPEEAMRDDQIDRREFTDEQLHAAVKRAGEVARTEAFAADLPVMYAEQDRLIMMYPDGHIEDVGPIHLPPTVSSQ
jgi:hypothetical protein